MSGFYYERGRVTGKRILCHHCPTCQLLTKGIQRGVWHCNRYEKVPWFRLFIPMRGSVHQFGRFVPIGDWNLED